MSGLKIIAMCIFVCVVYGIVHDQITARICVEYFTIGHPPVFGTEDPTLLGLGWGILATWWVGLILGVGLSLACRVGSWPKREPGALWGSLLWLCVVAFGCAVIAGVIGGVAGAQGWVFLVGSIAERVPEDRHTVFLIDLWAHSASYLVGFVGGIVLIVKTLLWRQAEHLTGPGVRDLDSTD